MWRCAPAEPGVAREAAGGTRSALNLGMSTEASHPQTSTSAQPSSPHIVGPRDTISQRGPMARRPVRGDSLLGLDLQGYVVTRILTMGGMGVVYEARHSMIGQRAAVKVLRPELSCDAEFTGRFLQEAQALSAMDDRPEMEYSAEFEEAALITLGLCYQENGRFSGGAYHSILKRCDQFLSAKLPAALETRTARAAKLLELNEHVNEAVTKLKEQGLESPYLKAFVVARINHLRFVKDKQPDFDSTIDKILGAARRFKPASVKADQVARSGGAPAGDE